ncbi:MAG TPA: DUF3592 domain-containing protein [Gammaproteobacteria bacterium]
MNFLVGIMILAGGLIVIFSELVATRELERIQAWPEARGEVESFAMSKTYVGDFIPSISYHFEVDGKEYKSDVIRRGGSLSFRSKRKAWDMERIYAAGAQVTVYYNPDSPQDCCVDRDETAGGNNATLWGMAIVALGGYVLFRAVAQ